MDVAQLAPGTLFANDFEIVRPLRAGGMGTIYVAEQKSTGKRRALKLMLPQLVADAALRKRFDQEARIASLIASDHVVEVVGAGVDDKSGVPWLAMELLEGRDLDDAVLASGPMLLAEAWRVMRELCHALAAAHAAGIVHRDLKPENVFLAKSNASGAATVVKVLDFGIAKIAAEATSKHTAALGSPIWMAPEQTERGAVTPAADVWALGLVAFFLLTGKCFWLSAEEKGATVQQIMREVLFTAIPSASERAKRYGAAGLLPPWFDAWFAKCVDRDPALRYPSAAKAFAAFDRACGTGALPNIAEPEPASAPAPLELPAPSRDVVETARTMPDPSRSGDAIAPEPASAATLPTAPSASELVVNEPARATPIGSSGARVRPIFVVLLVAVVGVAGTLFAIIRKTWHPPVAPPLDDRHPRELDLPRELAETDGGRWFMRVKGRCNPVEVDVLMRETAPPAGKDGAGFAAACFVLAGRVEKAKVAIDALPTDDRAWASWPVFEVVHPIADSGDDASAGPAMRLVLDYWPRNYMALYHAGMSEYAVGDLARSKTHLTSFLDLYAKPDGFTATGKAVLAELERGPRRDADCSSPLVVDPEGRAIPRLGCTPKR